MMPDFVFNTLMTFRILLMRLFGSKLQKLLINISENYYQLLSDGMIHEDAIAGIMKEQYDGDKKQIEDCGYFVYSRKQTIDTVFLSRFGSRGRFMIHLFKLIQKIYLDKYQTDYRTNEIAEMNRTMALLNKNFKKVVLYMFMKYDN